MSSNPSDTGGSKPDNWEEIYAETYNINSFVNTRVTVPFRIFNGT